MGNEKHKHKHKHKEAGLPHLITDKVPFEYVEAYKVLRTNFNFITANGRNRKIVVTSALRDEGKSSVSLNLAISLAQKGSKVLLIDADMRNPSLHRYLGMKMNPSQGLSLLLTGEVKVGDCLLKTDYGVDVIIGGTIPPNPVELISSDAMQDLLKVASEHYDYVICDAPPVGVITDAAALSPLCDGVLFVVRQKFASKSQVNKAIQSLKTVNAKILGIVLSQYNIPKEHRFGSRYSYYYYQYGNKHEDE